jgi:hypothetical protein
MGILGSGTGNSLILVSRTYRSLHDVESYRA